jgi:hypothetical protein
MNSEEQVRSALKALAEHDRALESSTPASAIFAQRCVAPRYRVQWWLVGAAAAVAAFAVALRMPTPKPKIPEVQIIEHPRIPVQTARAVEPAAPPKAKPVRRTKRVAKKVPEPPPQEIATEFFALMDAPLPMERGQIVRVVVPAATMRTVGLPITPERWNDRVQADVLVGEEGMARAIRFVSFSQ